MKKSNGFFSVVVDNDSEWYILRYHKKGIYDRCF